MKDNDGNTALTFAEENGYIEIVELLKQGDKCVCEIVEHVGTDTSNVSKHLSILKKQGIVSDRREGLKIFYKLTMPCALDFCTCIAIIVF